MYKAQEFCKTNIHIIIVILGILHVIVFGCFTTKYFIKPDKIILYQMKMGGGNPPPITKEPV